MSAQFSGPRSNGSAAQGVEARLNPDPRHLLDVPHTSVGALHAALRNGDLHVGEEVPRHANGTANHHRVQEAVDAVYLGLLNNLHERLAAASEDDQRVNECMEELFLAMRDRRNNSTEPEWREFVQVCRRHPLLQLLHQDPFTYRAFSKPRGYAGDARLMDFIYGREEQWPSPPAGPLGLRIFDYTTLAPAAEGVRARRAFVSSRIDRLAEDVPRAHVLSIAAGHLREANLSSALRRRRLGRMVALDADAKSLAEVENCYGRYGVEAIPSKFRRLLSNKLQLGQFDLVYSTGLFDYLDQPIGRRLTSTMFRMLRARGSLIVANFLPNVRDIGYMEAFMDWNLIYRSRRDMVDLTMEIPEAEIRQVQIQAEEQQNIIFLQVTRN